MLTPVFFRPPACIASFLAAAPPAPGTTMSSIWDMVVKGGWIMAPIGACSLVAIAIIAERLATTRKQAVAPRELLSALTAARTDPARALDLCAASPSPAAAILAAAIKSRGESPPRRDQLILEAGQRQVARLRQRTRLLSALPQTATMLGLLGTVAGMIRTFTVIAASGDSLGKPEKLAQGIHEAWTATAAGLVVAIPGLLAYHLVMQRIDAAAATLDQLAADWLEAERQPSPSTAAAAPVPVAAAQPAPPVDEASQPQVATGAAAAAA